MLPCGHFLNQALSVSLRQAKKRATRRRVIAAARSLLHDRGYETTTVDDIVRKAKISRMTFFNYFAGKDKVVEALAMEIFAEQGEVLRELLESPDVAGDTLPPLMEAQLELITQYRSFLKIVVKYTRLFSHAQVAATGAGDALWDYPGLNHRAQIEAVEQAQEAGMVRADVPAEEVCFFYYALRSDIVGRWLLQDGADAALLKARCRRAIMVFLQGLRPV
jgi:AcrR family transcriptional regulator